MYGIVLKYVGFDKVNFLLVILFGIFFFEYIGWGEVVVLIN